MAREGVLREQPTPRQILGVALGVAGLLIVAIGRGGHVPLGALLLCLGAAASWSVGNVITRRARVAGGLSLTVWSALVVPVPLFVLSLLLDGPAAVGSGLASFSWQTGLSTLYTALLSSLAGYGIYTTLLSRNPPSAVVPWILLVPPVAIVSAWALLSETPNAAELGGGALLVLGVLVASVVTRTRSAPAPGVDLVAAEAA